MRFVITCQARISLSGHNSLVFYHGESLSVELKQLVGIDLNRSMRFGEMEL